MENYLGGYKKDVCKHCKKTRTIEGYDGCIGFLPNVMNACCGHGENNLAYVQFNHKDYNKESNKHRIKGDEAIKYINDNKIIMKITKTLNDLDNSCHYSKELIQKGRWIKPPKDNYLGVNSSNDQILNKIK